MADDDKQTEEELVITETPPEADTPEPRAEDERLAAQDDANDDGDHDDGSDEADDDKIVVKAHKRRRDRQKRGREQSQQENAALRFQVEQLTRIVHNLQGNHSQLAEQSIDQRIAQVQADAREAEAHMASAFTEGDGARHTQAMRIRDAALAEANALAAQKREITQARQPQQGAQQQEDPRIGILRTEWLRDNSDWLDPNGPDAARVLELGNVVAAFGYAPNTPAYWHELTRRCNAEGLGPDDDAAPAAPRRKAPPTGTTRQHAPASTRNEVYVSPERKAAMQQAGVWDDEAQRKATLKYYQQYDRENAA